MSSFSTLIQNQALGQLRYIESAHSDIHGRKVPFDKYALAGPLEAFLAKHPMQYTTRSQVATHEAGHFVAFEACGLCAGTASIYGGRDGWSGEANAWNLPNYSGEHWVCDYAIYSAGFINEARAALAGPIAEELLDEGDAFDAIGELVEAALRANRAAQMLGRDEAEIWDETLLAAVAIVERERRAILDVAALLEKNKQISCTNRPVKKILAGVKQTPIDAGVVSQRGLALARKINDAVKELAQ